MAGGLPGYTSSASAGLRGWQTRTPSWPETSNTRVLRQEETADGHQQALGRHLGHRAGAE